MPTLRAESCPHPWTQKLFVSMAMKNCSFIIDDRKTLLNTLNSPWYLLLKYKITLSNSGCNVMLYVITRQYVHVSTSSHNGQEMEERALKLVIRT